ncbi:hypothetical protein AaE_015958 [Aphanomyces astaci]|uniref:Reverse transcriptase domain-containing protein n=1 Tax=Aphanomyces astaci TaxID=112090 RepID=A0A6A4YZL7_APHAT|nr:hypothetical protein AaE_015958 [Aphanomyces astaci]
MAEGRCRTGQVCVVPTGPHRVTWAAAPRIVAKKAPGEYRMTIDSRPINAWTIPMPWPMPNLDAAMATLVGMTAFFTLDWLKGYWQAAAAPLMQDVVFVYDTVWRLYADPDPHGTNGRHGLLPVCDEPDVWRTDIRQCFGWLDDLLRYSDIVDKLFMLLDDVLVICGRYCLKLHPKKCDFFLKQATWYRKVISAEGIAHSPDRVQGLFALETPTTGADRQQFVCATNWMRSLIPNCAELVDPLRALLDMAAKAADGFKTALDEDHVSGRRVVRRARRVFRQGEENVATHETHWSAACIQIPPQEFDLPVDQQRHEPLAFLSGGFGGASARWPTVEKEAFAGVQTFGVPAAQLARVQAVYGPP